MYINEKGLSFVKKLFFEYNAQVLAWVNYECDKRELPLELVEPMIYEVYRAQQNFETQIVS